LLPYPWDEDYLVERAVAALIDALVPARERAFNLEILEGNEVTVGRLREALETFPLFAGVKVVLVRNVPFFNPPALLRTKANGSVP